MALKLVAKKSPAAARMSALTIPAPPPAGDSEDVAEGPEGESGETCNATITAEQVQALQDSGSVTLDADDGEKVVLTMESESPTEDANEPGEEGA